jgi:hypothetical protein
VTVRAQAVGDAAAEGVPLGLTFKAPDDGGLRADAVLGSVAADCGLTGFCVRAAFRYESPRKG